MPKYLVKASYLTEGTKGLMKDGGSKRRAVVEQMAASFGGRVESFYYAFGDADAYIVMEAPDNTTAVAVSLAVNASGAVALKTIPLVTPEEVDQAVKKGISYRPPGA